MQDTIKRGRFRNFPALAKVIADADPFWVDDFVLAHGPEQLFKALEHMAQEKHGSLNQTLQMNGAVKSIYAVMNHTKAIDGLVDGGQATVRKGLKFPKRMNPRTPLRPPPPH